MKRFLIALSTAFGKAGTIALGIYLIVLVCVFVPIFPSHLYEAMSNLILPYYSALRIMSVCIQFIFIFKTVQILRRIIKKRIVLIRKRMLGFLGAAGVVQLFSFFCWMHVAPYFPENIVSVIELESFTMNFFIVEWLALIFAGYVISFYVGSLARGKFAKDVIIAPKKPNKE